MYKRQLFVFRDKGDTRAAGAGMGPHDRANTAAMDRCTLQEAGCRCSELLHQGGGIRMAEVYPPTGIRFLLDPLQEMCIRDRCA